MRVRPSKLLTILKGIQLSSRMLWHASLTCCTDPFQKVTFGYGACLLLSSKARSQQSMSLQNLLVEDTLLGFHIVLQTSRSGKGQSITWSRCPRQRALRAAPQQLASSTRVPQRWVWVLFTLSSDWSKAARFRLPTMVTPNVANGSRPMWQLKVGFLMGGSPKTNPCV